MPQTNTIQTGKLSYFLKFEKNVRIATATGGSIDNYVPVVTTKGYLKKRSGNRSLEVSVEVMNSTYDCWVRYQVALANDINEKSLRIWGNNRKFKIDSYELVEENGWFYKMILREAE